MAQQKINVTEVFLPPQEEYNAILTRAWDKKWLTNRGELVLELEDKLKQILGVRNLTANTNGTLPIQLALKLIDSGSEVITTPFSYVATTSSIIWEGHTPVFVDIDEEYLTIDENKIEDAITPKTKAILATHVYGNPCAVVEIEKIAKKHNLLVIYDAAHAFGVEYLGKSLFNYGDVSTCSFHATKIFHTGEGGCWITSNDELHKKMDFMHRFGHDGPVDYACVGINAKMSELQAAMGLSVIPYLGEIFDKRKEIVQRYNDQLKGTAIKRLKIRPGTKWNNHYYPIFLKDKAQVDKAMKMLNENNIYPRRYFFPSLEALPYLEGDVQMPISSKISQMVLCLPIYPNLPLDVVDETCMILKNL